MAYLLVYIFMIFHSRSFQTWRLYEILNYVGPHLCKSSPNRRDFLLVADAQKRTYELDIEVKTKMNVCLDDQTEEKRKNDTCLIHLEPKSISDVIAEKTGNFLFMYVLNKGIL